MHRVAFLGILLLACAFVNAQPVNLIDELKRFSEADQISFSYDPELLQNVEVQQRFASASGLIQFMNEETAVEVEQVAPNEYLIVPSKSTVKFQFDATGDTVLQPFYVDIIRGENEVLYQNFLANPEKPVLFQWTPRPRDTIRLISTVYEAVSIPGALLLIDLEQRVSVKEKVTYLDEILVQNYLAKGIGLNLKDQTTSIEMGNLALIPGETDGDVLASLATLPGINSPDSRPGNLFIRGSSTDQNLILYNNIPIYHRGHYYGSISPYNPAVISNVTVSKNGFNPRLGGRVGGAIEIRSQDEVSEYDEYGFGLNSLYGNAFLKTKVKKNWGVSISARRSLPSFWIPPKLKEISTMTYSATVLTDPDNGIDFDQINVKYEDYNFNLLWQPNLKNRFKLSGLYTNNATDYTLESDTTSNLELITYDNIGVSLEWDRVYSDNVSGQFVTFFSDYYSAYETVLADRPTIDDDRPEPDLISADIESENYLKDAGASYELKINKGNWNELAIGISSQWSQVRFEYGDVRRDRDAFVARRTDETFIHAAYGNYKLKGFGQLYFQVGGRMEYYSLTDGVYFSPRLLANYDLTDDLILKASAGRYYQFLNQMKYLNFGNAGFDNELWRLADGKGIRNLYSDQAMIGGVWTKGRWVFDVEVYRKWVNNVNYASTFRLEPETFYQTADWDIRGIDLFTKVQVTDGFSVWGSYERSEQTLAFDSLPSVSYQYKYNRPHRFKMGGLYQKGRWKLSYSWKILSGLFGRSVDILAELDQVTVVTTPPPMRPPPPGGGPPPDMPQQRPLRRRPATIDDLPTRYETFHGFDFFATYQIPKTNTRKWDAVIGLSLINLLNVENQIDQVVRGADERTLMERYALGFSPNLNITIKW